MRAPNEKDVIHVRDIEKMTAITNEEMLDQFLVGPEKQSSPDEHGEKYYSHAFGGEQGQVLDSN